MTFHLSDYKMDNGEYESFAWPGGYPLYFTCANGDIICPACLNRNKNRFICSSMVPSVPDPEWTITGAAANYEDPNLYCDQCSVRIPSAYADEED